MNLLFVVNYVSSTLRLCELVCNGIDCKSSVALIVARRDTLVLQIAAHQTVQSVRLRSNLQATAARGCTVPNKGLEEGRLYGEQSQTIGTA